MEPFKISIYQLLILGLCGSVISYPNGAPSFICNTMVPGHPPTTTSGKPPYTIHITSTNSNGGQVVVHGTLLSTNNSTFRGFLIEQLPSNGNFGKMEGITNISKNVCGPTNMSGLTHVDNSNKTEVKFTWTTLNSSIGNLQFRASVVESCCDVSRFWVNITSNRLPVSPSSTPVTSSSVPTTSQSPRGKIIYDPDCGKTKGCFSNCDSSGCSYLVTWHKNNNNTRQVPGASDGVILFDIKMKLNDTNNKWVAVGISPAGAMDGTNVAACLSQPSGVTLQSSYNDGYSNVPFNDTMLGLSLLTGDVVDGIVHCQYTRDVRLQNQTTFLDLNNKYYMLVGSGPVINGAIQQHNTDPESSPDLIDFLKTDVEPSSTAGTPTTMSSPAPSKPTSPRSPGKIVYDPECGVTKGCCPDCQNKECTYLVTWHKAVQKKTELGASQSVGTIIFDIQMKSDGSTLDKWIAVGISPKGTMTGTNVAACLSQSGGITLQSSYNGPYSNNLFTNNSLGLELLASDVTSDIIHCQFSRVERIPSEPNFLDLNNTYFVVAAIGPVVGETIQQHTQDPHKSEDKVDFLQTYVSKEDNSGPSPLIKLHASLMVIAWVFLSSIGIVAARHCKTVLEHELYMKVKAWFLVHRKCMFLAVTLVIIAFVAIFVEVGGFSKISATAGKEYTKAHPYTGIAATVLSIMNPILAMARPSPTARNRPLFNWVHFIIGNTAHIVAVVTIFFGIELASAKVHTSARYVMIAYSGIYVLVHFILEMYRRNQSTSQTKDQTLVSYTKHQDSIDDYDQDNSVDISKHDTDSSPEYGSVHRTNSTSELMPDEKSKQCNFLGYMLVIHAVMMLILAAFLVLIICEPQKMEKIFDQ